MNDVTGMPQSALVLGGTSDIAFEILALLARRRLRSVLLAGRDAPALARSAARLEAAGVARVETAPYDALEPGAAAPLAERARAALGTVDLVLVAVGELAPSELESLSPSGVERAITTNLTGPACAIAELTAVLRAQGTGRFVVLSSVAGVRARRANFVYGAAKAGLDAFCQGLGDALCGSGVHMTVVRPGAVRTKMTAGMPRRPLTSEPGEVARAVVAGIERDRPVVWVPGYLRILFALLRPLPGPIWRRLPF